MKKLSLLLAVVTVLMLVTPVMAGTKVDGNQVTFTFKAPDANMVYLSGNFNGWSPTGDKMTKGADGVWSVTIKLKPGTYQYKFVADGAWIADESAASFVDDGFGGKNSVLVVKAAGVAADARIDKLEQEIATLKEAQGGFQFNGYARTGYILDEDGNKDGGGHGASGAWQKYRLGNEADTYIENTLSKKWTQDDGSWAKATFMWAHSNQGKNNVWESSDAVLRQSFVELGNLPNLGGLTYWAGRRYYRRDDVHMTDWYWKDFSGIGAGVQGISLGDSKLDIAYMLHGDDYVCQQLIFSLTGVKIGSGTLEVDLAPTFQQEDSVGDSGNGTALAAKYSLGSFFGFAEGSSMVGLYYGDKLASNPNWYGDQEKIADLDDATHLRILASGVYQINDDFEIQPLIGYQKAENTVEEVWTTFGCRPVYHFNENFALQFELGYDKTEKDGKDLDKLTKFTIAPTITLGKGYYTRPQARVFVSQFNPDVGDSYMTYGIQMEAWW